MNTKIKNNIRTLASKHHKKIKFVIIGTGCFVINSIILYALTKLKLPIAPSQIIGYEGGLLFGYFMNSRWTFKKNDRGSTWSSILKYHWSSLSALLISTVIVVVLNREAGFQPNLALVVASAAVLVWNYFLFDRFVFSQKRGYPNITSQQAVLIKRILMVFLVWEVVMMGFGIWASGLHPISSTTVPAGTPYIIQHTYRWDSQWYAGISSNNWYKTNANSPAFYPLFPLIIHATTYVTGNNVVIAAFVVNFIATGIAFCFLGLIVLEFTKNTSLALRSVLFFAAFPAAFYMHVMYSEAIFCALGFAAFYYALRRRWLICCLLLALSIVTRLPGALFALACFIEYLRSVNYSYKKVGLNILYFAITPLGFLAYAYYLYKLYGSPLYMFKAYHVGNIWSYENFRLNIFSTMYHTGRSAIAALVHKPGGWFFYVLWQFPSMLAWLFGILITLYGWIRNFINIPMIVLVLGSCLLLSLNGNFVSVIRYILPLFPIYIVLAKASLGSKRTFILLMFVSSLVELCFYVLFVKNYFIA